MPSIIACDHASMSSKRILVRPVMSFRHSAESGNAKVLQRSACPRGASSSMMLSAWAWNCFLQVSRTVRGDTEGNIAARSAMCASPSFRIMLWPINVFINPAGWCDENTSILFSCVKMSLRRVNTVEPSCGTYAIGASFRIFARSGYGSAQNADTSMSKCGALDMGVTSGTADDKQGGEAQPRCQIPRLGTQSDLERSRERQKHINLAPLSEPA